MDSIMDMVNTVSNDMESQLRNAIERIGLTTEEVRQLARQGRTKCVRDPQTDAVTYYVDDIKLLTVNFNITSNQLQ